MLAHVLDVITRFAPDTPVIVVAQDCDELLRNNDIAAYADNVRWQKSQNTIAKTMRELLQNMPQPMLVTTTDNIFLSEEILAEFLNHSAGSDLAVGAVSKTLVMNSAYKTKRTWLKLGDESWSGCNLFYLGGPAVMPLLDSWATIEQSRKKAFSIFSAFGPYILLRFILGWLTIEKFSKLLSKRYNLAAQFVPLSDAKICIDADKMEDVALIESILCNQHR